METQVMKMPVNPKEFGLEETKANEMVSGLTPIIEERKSLEEIYNQVIVKELNDETLKQARDLRIKIRDNRTKGIMVWHKANKEFYLRGGQFVDAIKNKEIASNEYMEEKLGDIEKHFERIEAERIAKLKAERLDMLLPYEADTQFIAVELMTDEQFNSLLAKEKTSFEANKEQERLAELARIEAEKKAEEERIAREKKEAEEREAQRIENERLKAEAEAREKELAKERAKVEAERKAAEEKAAKERAEAEAKIKAEREAREKMEAELRAKEQAEKARIAAEEKAKKEAEILAKKQASAPDIEKLTNWVNSFEVPAIEIKNKELSQVQSEIEAKFNSFKSWAINQIQNKQA